MRIRPVNEHEREGERTVKKLSSDTLSVGDRKFIFDSVLDSSSKQVLENSCFTFLFSVIKRLIVSFGCRET